MKASFITRNGMIKLQDELNDLWQNKRPAITKKVAWAASLGDRSENADYQYNKKWLRDIDRRLRYLQKTIPELTIVDYHPEQEGKVCFGAWVEITNDNNERKRLRIVGYDEIFAVEHYISVQSPMAQALLSKQLDDEVVAITPAGKQTWYIDKIEYTLD